MVFKLGRARDYRRRFSIARDNRRFFYLLKILYFRKIKALGAGEPPPAGLIVGDAYNYFPKPQNEFEFNFLHSERLF